MLYNWEDDIRQAGTFVSGKGLKKEFESRGITADKEVVCYCHSDMRASHKYMQLRLAGSIIDWPMRKNPIL